MKLAKWFLILFGASVFAVLAAVGFLELVPPASIGVKQSLWGGSGVEESDYDMGFHIGITGFHKWHILDGRTHFLTFAETGTSSSVGQLRPPLVIRTKDNNTAIFDLTVTYRISEGQGYRLVQEGLKDVYRERVYRTVESVMREELAQLSSEDIYSTEKRSAVALAVQHHVEPHLVGIGVHVEITLVVYAHGLGIDDCARQRDPRRAVALGVVLGQFRVRHLGEEIESHAATAWSRNRTMAPAVSPGRSMWGRWPASATVSNRAPGIAPA